MADSKEPNGHTVTGRARRASEVVMQLDQRIAKEENIFLFLPNIIGTLVCDGLLSKLLTIQVTLELS